MAWVFGIAGALVLAYGTAIMLVGSGTWFFAFWYVLGAILLAVAWALHCGAWEALPLAARRAIEAVTCVVLACYLVTLGLQAKEFESAGEEGLDYIVVLGAQVHEHGPSTVLRYRLDAALDYLNRNPETTCIVSGGKGFNEHIAEAGAMANYLEERGVEPSRIISEGESRNTVENIANSMAYLDPAHDHVGIVTSNFHVFRGTAIARKHGIAHVTGISAPSTLFYLPNNMTRESIGIAKDFLTGNL